MRLGKLQRAKKRQSSKHRGGGWGLRGTIKKSKPICLCLTTRSNLHENDQARSYKGLTLRTRFETKGN